MDIVQLGAIGELVGGVAVVGSLIYVGIQLRQTRDMLASNAERDWLTTNNQTVQFAASSDALSEAWLGGMNDYRRLTPLQSWRFDACMYSWLANVEMAFLDRQKGIGRPESELVQQATLKQMLGGRGGVDWWQVRRGWFSKTFQAEVDRLLADGSVDANPPFAGQSS